MSMTQDNTAHSAADLDALYAKLEAADEAKQAAWDTDDDDIIDAAEAAYDAAREAYDDAYYAAQQPAEIDPEILATAKNQARSYAQVTRLDTDADRNRRVHEFNDSAAGQAAINGID